MQPLINRFKNDDRFKVCDTSEAWVITTQKPEGLLVMVTVPRTVREWFVDVSEVESGRKVWSDWNEHHSVSNETRDELTAQMRDAVDAFLQRVTASMIRLRISDRGEILEWVLHGEWKPVSLLCEAGE